jgi:hypothetical protein
MFALPKNRPALVDEDGGGGFWICDAVGARDWRIEYVLRGWRSAHVRTVPDPVCTDLCMFAVGKAVTVRDEAG